MGAQSVQEDCSDLLSSLLKKKKKHQVNILCGSQTATSDPGIFTKVQEIIRLFTVLGYMAVRRELTCRDGSRCREHSHD